MSNPAYRMVTLVVVFKISLVKSQTKDPITKNIIENDLNENDILYPIAQFNAVDSTQAFPLVEFDPDGSSNSATTTEKIAAITDPVDNSLGVTTDFPSISTYTIDLMNNFSSFPTPKLPEKSKEKIKDLEQIGFYEQSKEDIIPDLALSTAC